MKMAALGCFFVWVYLRILRTLESPEMAACVGVGLMARVAYAMWQRRSEW